MLSVPTVLEGILLSSHGVGNWKHMQGQFCICSCTKEIAERATELLANVLKHQEKKRPLDVKHLLQIAELINNFFF